MCIHNIPMYIYLFYNPAITECPRNCEDCSSETSCNNIGDDCRDHYLWDLVDLLCVGKWKPIIYFFKIFPMIILTIDCFHNIVECDFALETECTTCVSGTKGRYPETEERCYCEYKYTMLPIYIHTYSMNVYLFLWHHAFRKL